MGDGKENGKREGHLGGMGEVFGKILTTLSRK